MEEIAEMHSGNLQCAEGQVAQLHTQLANVGTDETTKTKLMKKLARAERAEARVKKKIAKQ